MTRSTILGGGFAMAVLLVLLVLATGQQTEPPSPAVEPRPTKIISDEEFPSADHSGFLYGRVRSVEGSVYVGRLRFGGNEEAFWGDYFNGVKQNNPWANEAPLEHLKKRNPVRIFGIEIASWEEDINLSRPFMARFGDISRIETVGRDLQVTLKNGTLFHLDLFNADDLADGLRIWDPVSGVVDLNEGQIRSIELLPTAPLTGVSQRLHGTVYTRRGDFTGFLQWDREECLGSDKLIGYSAGREVHLSFESIRSIERRPPDSSLVRLNDDREILLSETREVGRGNRGIYVDDLRYGRVLVSWEAFERVDFSPGGSGPAYDDFPPGGPLLGSVTTRTGHQLTGRLVFDLDESETTETLDAPAEGVQYTIPFGLIASLGLPDHRTTGELARLTLHSGEELHLERRGDLAETNGGLLIFLNGRESPHYTPWSEVEEIEFQRPAAMYPRLE